MISHMNIRMSFRLIFTLGSSILLTFKGPIIKLVDSAIYFFLSAASRSQCDNACEGSDEVSYASSGAEGCTQNEANESQGIRRNCM